MTQECLLHKISHFSWTNYTVYTGICKDPVDYEVCFPRSVLSCTYNYALNNKFLGYYTFECSFVCKKYVVTFYERKFKSCSYSKVIRNKDKFVY